LKRLTLLVVAVLFCATELGCEKDINKSVPKSLPPGAKPFQATEKTHGAEEQKTQDRAK
jgi:hypothetical protein